MEISCSTPSHTSHIAMASDFDPDTIEPPQHTSSQQASKKTIKHGFEKKIARYHQQLQKHQS